MPRLSKAHRHDVTVTVGELIDELGKYPRDMAIAYTWEGQILPVELGQIGVFQENEHVFGPVLLLDAET